MKMKPTEEDLTTMAFDAALSSYRGQGQDLFEPMFDSKGSETVAHRLIRQLERMTDKLAECDMTLDPFGDDDWHLIQLAIKLEYGIHFPAYTAADGRGNSDEPGFDMEEEIVSTNETDIRNAVANALYDYCLTAGALAKDIGASLEQRLFCDLLTELELNCRDHDYEANENGGLTEVQAKDFCDRLHTAQRGLWAAVQIECKRRTTNVSATTESEEPEDASAASPSEALPRTATPPQTIKLGEWGRKVTTKVDPVRRAITFRGNKGGDGKTLICPSKSDKAWNLVVRLLESSDPDGWVELEKNERNSWRQQFCRSSEAATSQTKTEHTNLRELLHHIVTAKRKGKTSAPTRIRIEQRERTPLRAKA